MQFAVAIDTFAFVKKLKSAGMNEEQAEAQAEAINSVLVNFQNKRLEELATKADLKAEIADIKDDISKTESKLIKWIVNLSIH